MSAVCKYQLRQLLFFIVSQPRWLSDKWKWKKTKVPTKMWDKCLKYGAIWGKLLEEEKWSEYVNERWGVNQTDGEKIWSSTALCRQRSGGHWPAKAIWHGLMCPLAPASEKSQTLPHTSAVTKTGQLGSVPTKSTGTPERATAQCMCVCLYSSVAEWLKAFLLMHCTQQCPAGLHMWSCRLCHAVLQSI